ncbi:MAG: MFS transporter [Pseudomonadota bacterium]
MNRWGVLAGLMLVYAATNGIVVHTLPLLYPALGDAFGWTTAQLTLPATVFFIFGAITSPPAGVLLDRYSPRMLMGIGVVGLLLGLAAYAWVSSLWQLVALYLLFGLMLSLCGLATSMVILTRWFHRHRGKATGLLLMASSAGGALFPLILGAGLERGDWRTALLWMTGVGAIMTLPALVLLIKDRQLGATGARQPQPTGMPPTGPTLAEALRSSRFYLIAVATAALWFSIVALLQHQALYLGRDVGVDRSLLPPMFSLFFACSIVGKLLFGWVSDYLHKEIAMVLSIALLAAGLILLGQITAAATNLLYIYALVTGIGFSGAFTMVQLLIAEHFAGPSYGKILTIVVMLDSLAGGAGTRVVALLRDRSGNYDTALMLLLVVCGLAMICVLLVLFRARMPITSSTVKENPL